MKNGYYISAYFNITRLGNLYNAGHRHDSCLALWKKDGEAVTLMHYWELERQTGIKQQRTPFFDTAHCRRLINKLLSEYGLTLEDVSEIWGVPELWEDDSYLSKHRYPDYAYHSISHLTSCLFMDTDIFKNENILAFSVDGGPDTAVDSYDTYGRREKDRVPFCGSYSVKGDKRITVFPANSPAVIWGWATIRYSMKEGSLMALASASKSETYLRLGEILAEKQVIANKDNRLFSNMADTIEAFTEEDTGEKFNYFDPRFSEKENKISMVMKIVQDMSYRIMERNIDGAIKEYGIKPEETYLAMSGGFALNCPCNTYLMKKYGFKGFIAPPCVSDSGMALGIGLYSFYDKTDGDFDFKFRNAYYGDSDDIVKFLQENKYEHFLESVSDFDAGKVAEDMEQEPVIWFDGQAEVGPRALGARSLIGDPRTQEMKDRLNEIKLRQWWRPVAPIILRDEMAEWFEDDYESPYMLHALRIREEKKALVPAIVHEDSTARLQSISEEDGQERLYAVVRAFYERTGIPMICNTSLNDKGEPIINRIEEAINFALRKNIRIGYFNGKRMVFKNHADYRETQPLARPLRMQVWENDEQWKALVEKYNPHHYTAKEIYAYTYTNIGKGKELSELDEETQKRVMENIREHIRMNPLFNKHMLLNRIIATNYIKGKV
jgi:predicted NodU family carbamoyl transferase